MIQPGTSNGGGQQRNNNVRVKEEPTGENTMTRIHNDWWSLAPTRAATQGKPTMTMMTPDGAPCMGGMTSPEDEEEREGPYKARMDKRIQGEPKHRGHERRIPGTGEPWWKCEREGVHLHEHDGLAQEDVST